MYFLVYCFAVNFKKKKKTKAKNLIRSKKLLLKSIVIYYLLKLNIVIFFNSIFNKNQVIKEYYCFLNLNFVFNKTKLLLKKILMSF